MQIILASNNANKAEEIRRITAPVEVVTLAELGLNVPFDAVEDGATYEENALKKVRVVGDRANGIVVADDSGLEVDALGGRPGIHSARYGGPGLNDRLRCEYLLHEMEMDQCATRAARFICVVAARFPDGTEKIFRGVLEGEITRDIRGESGFGYDPVFLLLEEYLTLAQIGPKEKNRISHRAIAFGLLKDFLLKSA